MEQRSKPVFCVFELMKAFTQ